MANTNKITTNFVGGEISPLTHARLDLPLYGKALARMENFLPYPQGPSRYRPGTNFVHFTKGMQDGVFIPFAFNASQAYLIEATNGAFRFYANQGVITGNDTLITVMTNANPGVFTTGSTAHGFAVGEEIKLSGMTGTNIVDGTTFTINTVPTTTTFTLKTFPGGTVFDTTSVGTFVPNGYATPVYNITACTQANPAVLTVPNNTFANGDEIFITGMNGFTDLNGKFFLVTGVSGSTFSLTDLFGNAIRSDLSSAYTSGGTAARVYTVTTPYQLADLPYLQFAQIADTMYITNQNYAPRKLVRQGNANWTLATFTRTGTDPFTGAGNWPACVCFDGNGRLLYASTATNPQTVWGSSAPSSGTPEYDDFTFGTAATNAYQFTLGATAAGRSDSIQWIGATDQFTIIGTFGTVRTFYGSAPGQPVTPTAVSAQSIGNYGCAFTLPVALGYSLFYIQRANQILRSIEFDIYINNYNTTDRTLVANHLTTNGLRQLALQLGVPDIIYATLGDGRWLAFTYQAKENVQAWARQFLGGTFTDSGGNINARANVRWVGTIPRTSASDQLWFIVQRQANGRTIYCVEYMTDYPTFPQRSDFYNGTKATDDQAFANAMFEMQKLACHLDMSFAYIGTQLGLTNNASITPGAGSTVTGTTNVTFTSNVAIFTGTEAGRELRGSFNQLGKGGGKAIITGVLSSTSVICNIETAFPSLTAITPGNWYITTNQVSGLDYLNGETLSIVGDGGLDVSQVVINGKVTSTNQNSVIFVGYPYTGIMEWLNIDPNSGNGSAQSKSRNIHHIALNFWNSLGAQYGTDQYDLSTVYSKQYTNTQLDRPTVPFTGNVYVPYTDSWDRTDKRLWVMQKVPLPCNVRSADIFIDTADDVA